MTAFDDAAECLSASVELSVQGASVEALARSLGMTSRDAPTTWSLSSAGPVDSRDVRRHLQWLVDYLVPRAEVLRQIQGSDGVVVGVTCHWELTSLGGGTTLRPGLMGALALLGLECRFDISFADEAPGENALQ